MKILLVFKIRRTNGWIRIWAFISHQDIPRGEIYSRQRKIFKNWHILIPCIFLKHSYQSQLQMDSMLWHGRLMFSALTINQYYIEKCDQCLFLVKNGMSRNVDCFRESNGYARLPNSLAIPLNFPWNILVFFCYRFILINL